jgi:hypothetical protein
MTPIQSVPRGSHEAKNRQRPGSARTRWGAYSAPPCLQLDEGAQTHPSKGVIRPLPSVISKPATVCITAVTLRVSLRDLNFFHKRKLFL